MFAQIVAIFIFLGMFLLIILDKFERHYVTLGSGALVLTLVFSVLAVTSRIDGGQFLNIFSIVIAFYFGTQHRKSMTQEVTQEKGDAE